MADSATSSVEPHLPTATFVELYVYGIYTCLFVFSALVLIKKFKNSATNKCLAAAMSAMYIIAGAHVVGESIKESSAFVPSNKVARFIEVETSLNFVFSDAIVIWRAYIIWARSRRVLLVPLVLLLITLITSLYRIICMTTADFDALSGLVPIAYMISLFASFLNNVAVTGLIGYRALQHYRSSSAVQIRVYRDRSLAILLLLVESGALYCAFWVVAIVIGFAVGTVFSAKYVCVEVQGSFGTKLSCTLLSSKTVMIFTALSPHVTGMYPTVIIALCKLQASYSATIMDLRDDERLPGLAPKAPSPSQRQPVQSASLRPNDNVECLAEESSSMRGSVTRWWWLRADREQIEQRRLP